MSDHLIAPTFVWQWHWRTAYLIPNLRHPRISQFLTLTIQVTHLIAPDLVDGGLVGVQREGLRAELDGSVGCQKDQGSVEEHVIHESGAHSHRPHCEEEQQQAHLGAALDRYCCAAKLQRVSGFIHGYDDYGVIITIKRIMMMTNRVIMIIISNLDKESPSFQLSKLARKSSSVLSPGNA